MKKPIYSTTISLNEEDYARLMEIQKSRKISKVDIFRRGMVVIQMENIQEEQRKI